jgi:tetratricopeptide (TPR) repeat protein
LFEKGLALSHLKRPDSALEAFDRCIELGLSNSRVHAEKGLVLFDLERYEDAIASFDRALEFDNADVVSHRVKGEILQKINPCPRSGKDPGTPGERYFTCSISPLRRCCGRTGSGT